MLNNPGRNIILFGPPGVGKGAQAEILSRRYGLPHLSTGELIREEIHAGTQLGKRVEEAVRNGAFADDKTVLEIVVSRIDSEAFGRGFVMDGFPRTVRQAEELDRLLAERDKNLDYALSIVAPEAVVLERLSGRLICSRCGKTFHRQFHRPRVEGACDSCQGSIVSRHDDNPEVHRERLRAYREKTAPLAEYYLKRGILRHIDGAGTIDAVAAEVGRTINGVH